MARTAAESTGPYALDERYTLLRPIGRGGIGEVYEGVQVALDRRVAIKLLRPEYTASPGVVERFVREARTQSRLHHPNVVTLFDVGHTDDGLHFLVMELLSGETLAERLEREGALPVEEALQIAQQIARGMGAGQGVGLVHRDLKPENLFLEEGGLVKILDFGIALLKDQPQAPAEGLKQVLTRPSRRPTGHTWGESVDDPLSTLAGGSGRLTAQGAVVGTPRYMSPEQVLGWQVDVRSDLYSFGCVLFEMLTGQAPFVASRPELYLEFHVHATPPCVSDYAPDAPDALAALVARLLEKDPARRPRGWSALGELLRGLQARPESAASSPAAPRSAPPTEPYRFLRPFSQGTRALFFGREDDSRRFQTIWDHADRAPMVILTGASGVGKTSFLNARVLPTLRDRHHALLTARGGARPLDAVADEARRQLARLRVSAPPHTPLPELLDQLSEGLGQPVTVVLDQLEELFTEGDRFDWQDFQSDLAAAIGGGGEGARVVISLREDYLGPLVRAMQPLPVDQLARTLSLRPLGPEDVKDALLGPTDPALDVAYAPFRYAPGLADEIVADLMIDEAGEVAPRIQAVGSRLWEMVRDSPEATITAEHYRQRLGGARGIVGRVLDEAVEGLEPRDRELAKEILRTLTHLPGSATSHPAPESALVGLFADAPRRLEVLRSLESPWRVIHGYTDARWPEERTYRLAHESLIERIREYGLEQTDRNRARQVFQQGLALWLRNGRSEDDLLSEAHLALVQRSCDDLVLTRPEQWEYLKACRERRDAGWLNAYKERRRERMRRLLRWGVAPSALVGLGFCLGQAPEGFRTLRTGAAWGLSAMDARGLPLKEIDLSGTELAGIRLKGFRMPGADLRGADLSGANLIEADLSGAHLERADLRDADLSRATLDGAALAGADLSGAQLQGARLDTELAGAHFRGAAYDAQTRWGPRSPPDGALGVYGRARGLDLAGVNVDGLDLYQADVSESDLSGASLDGAAMEEATLDRADLTGAHLLRADLDGASLRGTILTRADLADADLNSADLSGADLSGANLVAAELIGARLEGARLKGALADHRTTWPQGFDPDAAGVRTLTPDVRLGDVALAGAHLCGAALQRVDLRGADLMGAALVDSHLQEADLSGADLMGADLTRANLQGASLAGADLRGATLTHAQLCGADLSGALLEGADVNLALDCPETTWPGARPRGVVDWQLYSQQ